MERNEAINLVKANLKKERFEHTMRVAETAVKLAEKNNAPLDKVELAAILHDYAKNFPLDRLKQVIEETNLPNDLLNFHPELWHGPVASILIEQEYTITDEDIKNAVRYHTTGRAKMSSIERIIFVADYVEPGRSFPGVEEVREAASNDLNLAAWMALRNTIQFLVNKRVTVYPDTFFAYNELTSQLNGGN